MSNQVGVQNHMVLNPHHQYNGSMSQSPNMNLNVVSNAMGVGQAMLATSQYEYSIDSQPEQRQGSKTGQMTNKTPTQPTSTSLPKRTPHSELTSYQSEKRLKEYKQQQTM